MSNTIAAPGYAAPAEHKTLFGHPLGLYVCFFTEMWERFSFYGMKALLLLFLISHHRFTQATGYDLIGAYGGLVYAVPVIGGLIADRYLGMRRAVIFGGILLVCGHIGMAYEGADATIVNGVVHRDGSALQAMYLSLSLIIVGVGFLKPNISTIVGKLYPENDPRRDSGFTIFYAGINLGAAISAIVCGYLGETYGWKWGFGAAGIGMILGLLVFIFGQPHLHGHAEARRPELLSERIMGLMREHWIYLLAIASVGVVSLLLQQHSLTLKLVPDFFEPSPIELAMHAVTLCLLGGIGWFVIKQCSKVEREQMIAVLLFIAVCLVFFTLYEQTYGSWLLFSKYVMNKPMLFGKEVTASQLTSLGAIFIIALSPIVAWLWPRLEQMGINPSKPAKSALGLLFAGLSFVVLVYSARHLQSNGLTNFWWFALAYLVLEIGEVVLSPIGLAAVTQLSVARVVSVMMGGWFLGTSYSEILAAGLGKLSAIDIPDDGTINVALALSKYDQLFVFSAKIGIGAAVVMFVLTPLVKKLMHGVR